MRCKSEERRQAIVDVASAVFRELGFEQASMSEIAARVGGSKATLYSYFSSKEELFVASMRQCAEGPMSVVFRELDSDGDLRSRLQRFGERLIREISQTELIEAHRMVISEAGRSAVGQLFWELGPHRGATLLAEVLAQAMEAGQLRREDPMVAAFHLLALIKSESVECMLLGVKDPIGADELPRMVERGVSVFLRAYALDAEASLR